MNYFTRLSRFVALALFLVASGLQANAQNAAEEIASITKPDLNQFAGTYGPRTIGVSGDHLTFQRDGMPTAVLLKEIETDMYEIVVPAGAVVQGHGGGDLPRLHFTRDDHGKVDGLTFVMADGMVVGTEKKEDAGSGEDQ